MTNEEYLVKLRDHLRLSEGMDDSMLSFYISQAKTYVNKALGKEVEYLVIMVAGIMYEYRVSEKELQDALDALTPFFIQEAYTDAEETN